MLQPERHWVQEAPICLPGSLLKNTILTLAPVVGEQYMGFYGSFNF
jgi:hypothetical protein